MAALHTDVKLTFRRLPKVAGRKDDVDGNGFFDQQQFGQTGSRDRQGAGDHDQPYSFGWRPRVSVPFEIEIERYGSQASTSVPSKLSALMELERLRTSEAVAFLLQVLADSREPAEVRRHIVSWLRNGDVLHAFRARAGDTLLDVLRHDSSSDLRLQTAQALAEFADLEGVLPTLGALALDRDESPDLRYSAFISLQCTGPSEACVEVLERLSHDDLLGPSAENLLKLWRV